MVRAWHPDTPADVLGYVRETLDVIEAAHVPDDLRSIAFDRALALIASKQVNGQDVAEFLSSGIVRANGVGI